MDEFINLTMISRDEHDFYLQLKSPVDNPNLVPVVPSASDTQSNILSNVLVKRNKSLKL